MKEITKIDYVYHVISEPGDGTRYDYYVFNDFDNFCFMPGKSTFRFPQKLNYYEVNTINENSLLEMAVAENCNPWTLKECIKTIMELRD